jgi:ATP-dependent RNA helicase DDX3X
MWPTGRTGRIGNSGVATSFYNDRDADLAEILVKTLLETKQDVPEFLHQYIPTDFDPNTGNPDDLKFEIDSDAGENEAGKNGGDAGGDGGWGNEASGDGPAPAVGGWGVDESKPAAVASGGWGAEPVPGNSGWGTGTEATASW